jgi:hypothetical protein
MAFSRNDDDDDVLGMSRRRQDKKRREGEKNGKTDIFLIERRERKPDGIYGIDLSKIGK